MHCEIQNPKAGGHPRLVKATKRHICRECCRDIQPGEKYYRVDGVWEKPATFYFCVTCQKLIEKLRNEGFEFAYGELNLVCFHYFSDMGDDAIAKGRYCAIATTVPWLKRSNGRFELVEQELIHELPSLQ